MAKTGLAKDMNIEDASNKILATTVEGALAELADNITNLSSTGNITIVESTSSDAAKIYTFKQGNDEIGVINIPKDMVVESGSVVTLTETDSNGHSAGTYIKLILANSNNDEVWIPVDSLVEYVTGGSTSEITISVNEITHVATATINEKSIAKNKLSENVQASLDKAESAIQSVTILDTPLTNGSVLSVDIVKSKLGLGSAAYVSKETFDIAGSAANALIDAKAVDEKIILKQISFNEITENTTSGFKVPVIPDSGFSIVPNSKVKVIVNSVSYVVDASSVVSVNTNFIAESDDEIYVEFREKLS